MSPAHHRAAALVTDVIGIRPVNARAHLTWGSTLVVEAEIDDELTVYVKASGEQNVHTETAVIDQARAVGVPTVEVLASGTDDQLPGGRWMITRAAAGHTMQDVGRTAPTIVRTLEDLAEAYTRLHTIALPGFGPLTTGGQRGTLDSWSQWQQHTIDDALTVLQHRDAVEPEFVSHLRRLCTAFAADLDRAPAALLHADLGDSEAFVEPTTGALTAIVDWGGALIGDPLYDLVRFVGGGPADDPRPGQLHPGLHTSYFQQNPYDTAQAQRMLTFYRLHVCVVEAAWGEDLGWTPGHLTWADRLINDLGG